MLDRLGPDASQPSYIVENFTEDANANAKIDQGDKNLGSTLASGLVGGSQASSSTVLIKDAIS